jgi:hypothetical protein
MKTFQELTKDQQTKAVSRQLTLLLGAVLEGVRFNDELNGDDLQSRIDAAINKAETMHTPWFAHEYLMDDVIVKEALEGIVQCQAEDALYSEPGEYVVNGIVE